MQSEAGSAKNTAESAICGVIPSRPNPTGSVPWLVPVSSPRSAHCVANEVSVSQQLARRHRHFLHAGNNPERANAAQAPAPLGASLRFEPAPNSATCHPVGLFGTTLPWWKHYILTNRPLYDPFTGQAVGGARVGAGSRPSSGASPSRSQIGTGDGFVASHCDRAGRAGARMCGAIGRFPRSRVIAVHACSLLVALAGTTDTDTTELTLRG